MTLSYKSKMLSFAFIYKLIMVKQCHFRYFIEWREEIQFFIKYIIYKTPWDCSFWHLLECFCEHIWVILNKLSFNRYKHHLSSQMSCFLGQKPLYLFTAIVYMILFTYLFLNKSPNVCRFSPFTGDSVELLTVLLYQVSDVYISTLCVIVSNICDSHLIKVFKVYGYHQTHFGCLAQ